MPALRLLLGILVFIAATSVSQAKPTTIDAAEAKPDDDGTTHWYDAQLLTIEGRGWSETKSPYDRLPAKAEGVVRPPVWNLSQDSAGIAVRFTTDAPSIHVRWTLTSASLAMPHMPATGVSGVDLYVRDPQRHWRWLANGRPKAQSNTAKLVSDIPAHQREYMLYLPLYNGVTSVEIGIPKQYTIAATGPRAEGYQKPLVFYGTSITQGGCASRPGMVHTSIIGRRFDRPVINLGFSGNGRMETEVAELMAEIDAEVYILDCLPNITAEVVTKNTKLCVDILRKAHPTTPILFVEDRSYSNSFLVSSTRQRNLTSRAALREVFNNLKSSEYENIFYLEGDHLLGNDNEGTVDSSHPTDLGFQRQADAFADALGPILFGKN